MTKEEFGNIAHTIPHQPGCYKYYNEHGEILYVGKAKDLRKRVSSYFNKMVGNYKTKRLVALITNIEFTVTPSEHDAFLLENSLIKHYQPRFNISLKDDKSYPFIVIKKEPFPRVFLTRRLIRDGSEYIGPFTGLGRVKELLGLVKESIPLRTCNLNLTQQNINKKKFKVCLEYHLGNCKGPCEGYQSLEDYNNNLQQVRYIMKGKIHEVIKYLKDEMAACVSRLEFEKAQVLKNKIELLADYKSKSVVVNPKIENADVATIISDDQRFYINYMIVDNGSIVLAQTIAVDKKVDETERDVLSLAVVNLREKFNGIAPEIIVPMEIDVADNTIKVTIPKAGDKKQLLEMSLHNANLFMEDMRKKAVLNLEGSAAQLDEVLESMQEALHLTDTPVHIECFDNSNFQGSYPVAAMVCFKNGLPFKKEYRHFHIRTVEGINDFASMKEIVYRRYKKLSEENKPLPQLVIIDGGKGQLGSAMEAITELGLIGRMAVVGLAKREESLFFPGDSEPLQLPYDHPAHLLIRRIRDEVHRFGITFHRKTRSKGTIKNELEDIMGIGEKTATELLREFRSVKNLAKITERELTRVIGASKARIVYEHFHKEVIE